MNISIVSAMTNNRIIGSNNTLPWRIPEELQYFKEVTMGKPMIMGRKTFASIGNKPLPGRQAIVLTNKDLQKQNNTYFVNSVEDALQIAQDVGTEEVMVAGGAMVYQQFLPIANKMYLSIIKNDYEGDTLFPEYNEDDWVTIKTTEYQEFTTYIFERNVAVNLEDK